MPDEPKSPVPTPDDAARDDAKAAQDFLLDLLAKAGVAVLKEGEEKPGDIQLTIRHGKAHICPRPGNV